MSTYFERVNEAAPWIRAKFREVPDTAVVLGSGLGTFAESLAPAMAVAYETIPHWPPSRVIPGMPAGSSSAAPPDVACWRCQVASMCMKAMTSRPSRSAIRVLGRLGVRSLVLDVGRGRHQPAVHARRADGARRSHQLHRRKPARRIRTRIDSGRGFPT